MGKRLPDEVTRFITKHIHGFIQLELLLYMHDRPDMEATAQTVAGEHRIAEDQSEILLEDLRWRGLLVARNHEGHRRYRFEPKTRELGRQVDAVSECYPTYRHAIVKLIFSKPAESASHFADAFRLRKDEEDG